MTSTKARGDRLLAFIAGCVVATSLTNTLFSLTEDPTRGFDLHYADVLLIPLLATGLALGRVRKPDIALIVLSSVIILSTLWSQDRSLTFYTATKFSIIILLFSSLRRSLQTQIRIFFIPIAISAVASLGVSIYQLAWLDATRASGITGNPNLLAGLGMTLMIGGLWTGPLLISMTGTRSVLVALAIVYPIILLDKKRQQKVLLLGVLLIGSMAVTTGIFGTYQRITNVPENIAQRVPESIRNLAPSTISREPAPRAETGRQSVESIKDNPWLGTGFDTQTSLERNPHNIYLLLVSELGMVFGILCIGLLFFRSIGSITLIAVLIVGYFDHYWITTAQGIYLLSALLAFNKVEVRG